MAVKGNSGMAKVRAVPAGWTRYPAVRREDNPAPDMSRPHYAPWANGFGSAGGGAGQYDYSKPMYQTGPNERQTVTMPNGQQVRMAPNTVIYRQRPVNPWQNFINTLTGRAPRPASGVNGVRG